MPYTPPQFTLTIMPPPCSRCSLVKSPHKCEEYLPSENASMHHFYQFCKYLFSSAPELQERSYYLIYLLHIYLNFETADLAHAMVYYNKLGPEVNGLHKEYSYDEIMVVLLCISYKWLGPNLSKDFDGDLQDWSEIADLDLNRLTELEATILKKLE